MTVCSLLQAVFGWVDVSGEAGLAGYLWYL